MKRSIAVSMLCLLLFLCGCSEGHSVATVQSVEDPFASMENVNDGSERPATQVSTTENDSQEDFPPMGMGFGLMGDFVTDESGRREYLYNGGEMHLGYWLEAEGMSKMGLGLFLFVDGQPQLFKTKEDETERYMHVLYPPEGEKIKGEFIFTPVVGEQGDALEIYTMDILYPTHSIDDPPGAYQTAGGGSIGSKIAFRQNAPKRTQSLFQERVLSQATTHTDLTASEISGWSQDDLRNRLEYHFYVNKRKDFGELFGVADTQPLDCRFEMWGCPNGEFTLTIFLNHEPVYVQDISAQYGQKVISEIHLDISNYGREGVLFAVLVAKNQRSQQLDYGLETSGTFYITDAATESELKGSNT